MLPTTFQQFIHLSRYSRWVEEEKRRETWQETVNRYVDNVITPVLKSNPVVEEIREAILNLEVMPSMRGMMTAGKALLRDNTCLFNCAYITVDNIRAFDEAMFILLCGTGVGFSVERQNISKLPDVPEEFVKSDTVIRVEDSKEGWARSYRELLGLLYSGAIPEWDTSKVRPAGARLKTFGGRASGPGPLIDLFKFTIKTFTAAAGRKLNSVECHDIMCKIGDIVVSGGVRRSAMLSLSNLSDNRMRHAKSGQWWETNPHRALANNSVAYTEKPDMESFMREWLALMESKSGERGIFNRVAAKRHAGKSGRRETEGWEFGTNPCCVSGETEILTIDGYVPIDTVIGTKQTIWNGENWAEVEPYEAGEADLVRVTLTDGSSLKCTWNHRWVIDGEFVETESLKVGDKLSKFDMPIVTSGEVYPVDAYSQGFYSGDGNTGLPWSFIYAPKFECRDRLIGSFGKIDYGRQRWKHGAMMDKTFVPVNGSLEYRLNWLAGILDADGTVTHDKNGSGFQIGSIDCDFLNRIRIMLTTMGVRSKVVGGHSAGSRSMPDGKGGLALYECKESFRLLIGNTDAYHLINLGLKLNRLRHGGGKPQRDARQFVRIKSIEPLDRFEMTYCYTEPETSRGTFNGIVTGNSEIILRPQQFCNLSEPVVRADDTVETLKRKVRLASIIGTVQSTYTKFPYLRKIWQRNTEEERLLGVSLTGILDHPHLLQTPGVLGMLKQVAIDTNAEFAELLGIEPSAAVTCVKPSGTVSQLVDSASGCHARHSSYYIRTVRGDVKDPLTKFMIDAGVPHEPCVMKPETTVVFSFPQKAPEGAITRHEMTAIDQLKVWLKLQREYTEHKPSVTISVRDCEWLEVGAFVYENFDEMSGVSFLPMSDHTYQQAPYQDCSREEYEAMVARMPEINWDDLRSYETDDNTTGSQTMACTAGACEIVDIGA